MRVPPRVLLLELLGHFVLLACRWRLAAHRLDGDLFGGASLGGVELLGWRNASLGGGAMLRGRHFAWRSRVALTEQLTLLIFSLSLLFRCPFATLQLLFTPPLLFLRSRVLFLIPVLVCGSVLLVRVLKEYAVLSVRVLFLIPVSGFVVL